MKDRPSHVAAVIAAFALAVGFTYSNDIIELALELSGHRSARSGSWLFFGVDCLLVVGTGVLKWRIEDGHPGGIKGFLRELLSGWWALGAGLVAVAHLIINAAGTSRAWVGVSELNWLNALAALVFATAVTVLLLSALGQNSAQRGWVIPLAIGTFVVEIAALWYPAADHDCVGKVAPNFFFLTASMVPTLLLAIGVEFNAIRRTEAVPDPARRAAPVLTLSLLSIAELLAFSMVVQFGIPRCGAGAVWHEYLAFLIIAQAVATGLSTAVWLLIAEPTKGAGRRTGETRQRPRQLPSRRAYNGSQRVRAARRHTAGRGSASQHQL